MMKKIIASVLALILIMSICPFSFAASAATVLVTDESGKAVAGAKVQLCDDKTCFVQVSGADGTAVFADLASGEYEVHILKVPEGFAKTKEVKTVKAGGTLSFALKSEGAAETKYPEPAKTYASLDEINFADYRLILVNYWEPWCHWCLEEMPDFEKLWQEYRDKGLLIVGMYSSEEDAAKTIEELGISYPTVFYDGPCEFTESGVPATVFYDAKGNILPAKAEDFMDQLTEAVNETIEAYLGGEFDEFTDEDSMEIKTELDGIVGDDAKIKEYCREIAEGYAESGAGAFVGYADYGTWKGRIESRLA